MATEGIAAALTLSKDIKEDLKTAQYRIDQMAVAAEKLGNGFEKASRSIKDAMSSLNGKNISASFDSSGIIKYVNVISDAVVEANKVQNSFVKKTIVSEETLNARLDKIFSKRADSYAAASQRIAELEKFISDWKAGDTNAQNSNMGPFDPRKLAEAEAYLESLRERIETLKMSFNKGVSSEAVAQAIALDDSTYESALTKLKVLKAAEDELLKPGKESASSSNWINEQLKKVQSQIDATTAKMKEYQKEEKRVLEEKATNLSSRISSALGDKAVGLESMKQQLELFKRLKQEMRETHTMNLINPSLVEDLNVRVQNLNKRIRTIKETLAATGKSAAQFKSMIGSAFSIVSITNFLRNLVAIRGEFEMQERSLAVIIKDATYASEIFKDIEEIAVRSPFSVMDITKQTKQLAAYRIESDKLIDTVKMLGDISAGVGVDMNRLILAYGQVKAATVLKGTELRQFSEAGVNMLGGLADRFSDIYQRAVSTGEVLQMISKKMVSFEDVDAVLRKQVEAGGTFYKMQEIQAETLQGAITNLKDRIQIAFNEMGKSYDSVMKGIVKIIEDIIARWELFSNILVSAVGFKAVAAVVNKMLTTWIKISKVVPSVKNQVQVMNRALSISGVHLKTMGLRLTNIRAAIRGITKALGASNVIGILVSVGLALANILRQATELNRTINKIAADGQQNAAGMTSEYNRLASIAGDITVADKTRKKAIDELKNSFGNILDLEKLELGNADELINKKREQIALIREYAYEQAKAQAVEEAWTKLNKTEEKRQERLYDTNTGTSLIDFFVQYSKDVPGIKLLNSEIVSALRSEVEKELIDGTIKDAEEASRKFLSELLRESGASTKTINDIIDSLTDDRIRTIINVFKDVESLAGKLNTRLGNKLDSIPTGAGKYKDIINEFKDFRTKFSEENSDLAEKDMPGFRAKFHDALQKYYDSVSESIKNEDWGPLSDELKKVLQRALTSAFTEMDTRDMVHVWFDGLVSEINAQFPDIKKKVGYGELAFGDSEDWDAFVKKMADGYKELKDLQEDLAPQSGELPSDAVFLGALSAYGDEAAKAYVNTRNELSSLLLEQEQFGESSKDTAAYQELSNQITQKETQLAKDKNKALIEVKENVKEQLEYNELIAKQMGIDLATTKESNDAERERISNLKSLIAELKKAKGEFGNLDDIGDELLNQKLNILARNAAIIKAGEEDLDFKAMSQEELDTWLQKLVEDKRLTKQERIDIKLGWKKDELEKTIKELSDEASNLWDKYGTAKKFTDFGVSMAGYDSGTIYNEILKIENELRQRNTDDSIKAANDIKEKRLSILRDEQEEAAKIMYESQKKALSETEQLYQEMYEDISKMRNAQATEGNEYGFSKKSVDEAIVARIKKGLKDISSAQWDAYQKTRMYTTAFGDLQGLSKDVLDSLYDQLEGFSKSQALSPTEMNRVVKTMENIRDASNNAETKGFFSTLTSGFTDISKAMKIYKEEIPELSDKYIVAITEMQSALGDYNAAEALAKLFPTEENINRAKELYAKYQEKQEAASVATENLSEAQKRLNTMLNNAGTKVKKLNENYDNVGNAMASVISLSEDVASAFGLSFSEETMSAISGFQKGFALVGTALASLISILEVIKMEEISVTIAGVEMQLALWPLLAIGAALGAVVAIMAASDKKLENQVEAHKKAVEELQDAYEELEERFESVLSIGDAMKTYNGMVSNLKKQYEELNEAIDANNRRKQTENVKNETEELKDQLDEVSKKMKEANEQKMELLGAPSNYQDVAKDWASSWLDSFKETGDGISALEDSFNDLYDSIIAGQIQSLVMGPAIKNLENMINSALSDFYLSDEEARAIKAYRDNELAVINQRAKDLAEYLGVGSTSSFEGDTLQRGIEGVTEQTAQALESILNSTRYYVADNNRILLALESAFTGEEGENTILSNIRAQTKYLRSLATIADAVYYSGSHPKGAGGIKVFID